MILSDLDTLLWAAGVFGNSFLVLILLVRGRNRFFPFFTLFVAASVGRSLTLWYLARHYVPRTYFLAYWALAILVDVVLQSLVVFETAGHVFRPLGYWAPDIRKGMAQVGALSLLLAAGLAWLATPVSALWQESLVAKGNFFFSVLMVEILAGMVVLSVTVGLPWRTHVARIAQGFGLYAAVELSLEAAHALFGKGYRAQVDVQLTHARMVAYVLCLAYWGVTLWQNAPAPRQLPDEARKHLRDLHVRLTYDLYTLRSGRRL